jgi:hypothetical protein
VTARCQRKSSGPYSSHANDEDASTTLHDYTIHRSDAGFVNLLKSLAAFAGVALYGLVGLTACLTPVKRHITYESKGTQIGVETDRSTDDRTTPPILNKHPARLTVDELRTLLGALEVSGWSGTIVGLFETPRPKPVFSTSELLTLAEPLAKAFQVATPRDRVFFSLQDPQARYETDRTAGNLFFRDAFLHVTLVDHYGFLKADPGGGERRDPRDTKGMKLWVMRPATAAVVPEEQEPDWPPLEKVHISLNVRDVLTALAAKPPASQPKALTVAPAPPPSSEQATQTPAPVLKKNEDLHRQVQELEGANDDLRSKLEKQSTELEKLKEDLRRLREEMNPPKPPKSSSDRQPARKPSPR